MLLKTVLSLSKHVLKPEQERRATKMLSEKFYMLCYENNVVEAAGYAA